MKRTSFLLILCSLILSLGATVFAQTGQVTVNLTTGVVPGEPAKLNTLTSDVVFDIVFNNTGTNKCDISNGWVVGGDAPWVSAYLDYTVNPNFNDAVWFPSAFIGQFGPVGVDGFGDGQANGPDTLGVIGAGRPDRPAQQLPAGFNGVVMKLHVLLSGEATNAGKFLCIDSSFWGTGGTWKWTHPSGTGPVTFYPTFSVTGGAANAAGQGKCFELYLVPNLPPTVTAPAPVGITDKYCATFTYDFDATDPEGDDIIAWEVVSGGGSINADGQWTRNDYGCAQVGAQTVQVRAKDEGSQSFGEPVTLNVTVTNAAPAITCPAASNMSVPGTGTSAAITFTDDCPAGAVLSVGDDGDPTSTVTLVGNTVQLVSTATTAVVYTVPVTVTDACGQTATCNVVFNGLSGSAYNVAIEKTHNTLQGGFETVSVFFPKDMAATLEGNGFLGGFNILIAYDNSALSLQEVSRGTIYGLCGWEYFSYRFGADGNCNGGCPSGLVRVIGIAETNNGADHPVENCAVPAGTTLFDMKFLVSNDRTLECMYAPIRFFWIDCLDNSLSSGDGNMLYVEANVYDFDSYDPITYIVKPGYDPLPDPTSFPTYAGISALLCEDLNECWIETDPFGGQHRKCGPQGEVSFFNGGVDIICAKDIDDRGDINLNGFGYEIADAVLFSLYFVKGLSAFTINAAGQIAATDVNADGLTLTVADLVYLIRVIVGDEQPYDNPYGKVSPISANYVNANGTLSVDAEMGAALVVVKGNVTPTNLTSSEMLYEFDGTNTRILVYPDVNATSLETFSGNFINVGNAEVVSIEFGSAAGALVNGKQLPANFALNQNYPNPFNPATTISFALPKASDYTLTIYNVTGQKVAEYTGAAEAGTVDIVWNASENASGIYFYKLNAGSFSATKKMVLVK